MGAHMDANVGFRAGMTAMVNMYNAKVFLEEGRYEPSAAVQARGVQKVSSDTFMRTFGKPPGTKPVPYQVTDKAPPAVRGWCVRVRMMRVLLVCCGVWFVVWSAVQSVVVS